MCLYLRGRVYPPISALALVFAREAERSRTSQLGRRGAHESDEARGVDDAAAHAEALALVGGVLAHREDRVLAPPPHALDVDVHGQIPDALLRVERVVVVGVHDPGVVELWRAVRSVSTSAGRGEADAP